MRPAGPVTLALLRTGGLPEAWRGCSSWRILDTRLNDGQAFLATWQAWRDDAPGPRMLHYVALAAQPPQLESLLRSASQYPELRTQVEALAGQWSGLLPGFHRFMLQEGRLLLTLCIGDTQTLLREQQFSADTVYLDASPTLSATTDPAPAPDHPWDRWCVKALVRCCRRGTRIAVACASAELRAALSQSGFELHEATAPALHDPHALIGGLFNPHWALKSTRRALPAPALAPGHCAVIGAGLAGASVAAALARRGWQVTVLDAAPSPAAAASGLPAGLMLPHVSGDDSPRSRLSRRGMRLMLQQADRLLQRGQDWGPSGVLEHRLDKSPGLPADWPPEGLDWSRPGADKLAPPWCEGMRVDVSTLWHAQGAWIKPQRIVQAWLAQEGVRFQGQASVARLQRAGHDWQLLDASGALLTSASHVVLANGAGLMNLLAGLGEHAPQGLQLVQLPALQALRGQVSWALQRESGEGSEAALPPFPVNGMGSLIPQVPLAEGLAWFAGATYEDEAINTDPIDTAAHHHENLQRLHTLLPMAAHALSGLFDSPPGSTTLQAWSQTRCVAADRLPLLGPLDTGETPTLWVSSAMGSRGLTLAMLCAELLAARWHAEPWPLEASLAAHLLAGRGTS